MTLLLSTFLKRSKRSSAREPDQNSTIFRDFGRSSFGMFSKLSKSSIAEKACSKSAGMGWAGWAGLAGWLTSLKSFSWLGILNYILLNKLRFGRRNARFPA